MENQDFDIFIYVPEDISMPDDVPMQADLPVDESRDDMKFWPSRKPSARVVSVKAEKVREQWGKTLDTVMGLSSAIAQRSQGWVIDEIEVGLTLSASGQLLFIANAGAEASIKFLLKPKPNA